MKYSIDYFINKFESIPEEKWCTIDLERDGKSCAYGHCGVRVFEAASGSTEEAIALSDLFKHFDSRKDSKYVYFNGLRWGVINVNDSITNNPYANKPTSKQRILAALYDMKKAQEPKEVIRYVAVSEKIRNDVPAMLEEIN